MAEPWRFGFLFHLCLEKTLSLCHADHWFHVSQRREQSFLLALYSVLLSNVGNAGSIVLRNMKDVRIRKDSGGKQPSR